MFFNKLNFISCSSFILKLKITQLAQNYEEKFRVSQMMNHQEKYVDSVWLWCVLANISILLVEKLFVIFCLASIASKTLSFKYTNAYKYLSETKTEAPR